ncbi:Chromosome transmission fidelity protein 8, partial [Irineochytrium annulatum]
MQILLPTTVTTPNDPVGEPGRDGIKRLPWIIVELQGTIEVSNSDGTEGEGGVAGLPLGDLFMENGKPVLIIGRHRLVGEIVKLKKPFAVVRRVRVEGAAPTTTAQPMKGRPEPMEVDDDEEERNAAFDPRP